MDYLLELAGLPGGMAFVASPFGLAAVLLIKLPGAIASEKGGTRGQREQLIRIYGWSAVGLIVVGCLLLGVKTYAEYRTATRAPQEATQTGLQRPLDPSPEYVPPAPKRRPQINPERGGGR